MFSQSLKRAPENDLRWGRAERTDVLGYFSGPGQKGRRSALRGYGASRHKWTEGGCVLGAEITEYADKLGERKGGINDDP